MKVLLIDDVDLTAILDDYLSREGGGAAAVQESGALAKALSGASSVVILDAMIAGLNGMEPLARIEHDSQVPVFMLSSPQWADGERRCALESGADDDPFRPCTLRELADQIRAFLRRPQRPGPPVFSGRLAMWPERREARWAGRPLELTSTEFNLLEVLVRHAGAPVSKRTLAEQGLGRPLAPYDRNIDVHLSSVRRKLGGEGRSCIQAVQRVGYQFIADP